MSEKPQPWKTTTYEDVAGRLADLRDLARELGSHNAADRLAQLLRLLSDLTKVHSEPGGAQAVADRVGGKELLWQIAEATELADTMPWLRSYPSKDLPLKLREALEGPLLPTTETSLSSRGRNITFELNLASRLLRNGYQLAAMGNADLATRIDGHLFIVQCKRPFSESKFARAARLAFKQLKRDLRAAPSPAWGVIAISVGRIVNPKSALFIGAQRHDEDDVDRRLDALADRHVGLQRALRNHRILGLLLHVLTPAYYPSSPTPISPLQRTLLLTLHPHGTLQHALFLRLCSAMAPGGWLKVS